MRNPQSEKILDDQECFEIVRKKLSQESMDHYKLVSYEVVPLSSCSGFMGQYFKLKATVASSLDTRKIEFFTKLPPSSDSPQHDFNIEMGSFRKEVDLYTTVFPEVLSGLDKRCIPECFLGLDDAVIVLEDMAHSGFVMTDKYVPFDYEHCAVMMRTLGKFHAKSMIFEELAKKSLHDEFSHCMHETLWPLKGQRATKMFAAAVKGSISIVDLLTELSEEQKQTYKEKIANLSVNHTNKLLPSSKYRNVLCHGDLWANNILFKYNSEGKPVSCCLVDFQLARYNPPVHDIMCFLQFSTTRQLRADHLDDLLRIYHESVTESLAASSLDAQKVFPWEELEASAAELRTMCMVHGILNVPIMLLDEAAVSKYFVLEPQRLEELLYVDRTPLVCGQFEEVPAYRERMRDAFLELHDRVCA
ncbi:hypothetical protein TSAR_015143 [Trichomalopsis sarcophagae]|uniref:CHK kinase-like domain-containing protein n=1 Tax=Trichomalopsis sarcophagae TaxID=543379 RepID=A0A232F7W4_9HYME|nr:hypothetical protein TSAR_015143 [Trichomalopsis sarcophagae]